MKNLSVPHILSLLQRQSLLELLSTLKKKKLMDIESEILMSTKGTELFSLHVSENV